VKEKKGRKRRERRVPEREKIKRERKKTRE